jgi:uncharacterized membrane protein YgcG
MKKTLSLILLLLISLISLGADIKYPKHKTNSYVNDFANMFEDEKEIPLDKKIRDFKEASSIEMTIVTIDSLNGVDIQTYTTGLANYWGVGKSGLDNGIMILFSKSDRKWRIEIGYGLEEWITDGYSKNKAESLMVPLLKEGKSIEAVIALVDNFIEKLQPISWEQRQKYLEEKRIQSEKAKQEFKESLVNILLILGLSALIFTLGYLIWLQNHKRKMKLKLEAEEKKRRIVNLKYELSQLSSKVNTINSNIYVMTSQNEVKLNLSDINNTINSEKHNLISDGNTEEELNIAISSYKNLLSKVEDKFNNEYKVYKRIEDIKFRIANNSSEVSKMKTSLLRAKDADTLLRKYNINVNNNFEQIVNSKISEVISFIEDCKNKYLTETNIAEQKAKLSELYLLECSKLIASITTKKDELVTSDNYVNNFDLNSNLSKLKSRLTNTDVSQRVKTVIRDFINVADKKVTEIKGKSKNPIDIKSLLMLFVADINKLDAHAKKEIEEAEEERRRQKRKKDEEERRRRNNNSTTYGGSGFGGGFGSSSSSSSSFGGGRFGGGGSSGGW